jgi:hypothetical protein
VNTRPTQIGTRLRWLCAVAPRRRFPRFEIDGTFTIEDVTTQQRVRLLDVSVGGFRSASPVDLRPGTVRAFRFPSGVLDVVTLTASVVHCYPVHGRTDAFTVGWAWANAPVNVEGLPIGALAIIDYLTSERSPVDVREESQGARGQTPEYP